MGKEYGTALNNFTYMLLVYLDLGPPSSALMTANSMRLRKTKTIQVIIQTSIALKLRWSTRSKEEDWV